MYPQLSLTRRWPATSLPQTMHSFFFSLTSAGRGTSMRTVSCLDAPAPARTHVQARRPPPSLPPMTPPQSGQTTASTDIEKILSGRCPRRCTIPVEKRPPAPAGSSRRSADVSTAIVARVPRRDEVRGPRASHRRGGFIVSFVKHNARLPNFLPGRLVLERGTGRDYRSLAPFHYAAGAPATWAGVWVVRYAGNRFGVSARDGPAEHPVRTVAIGVLSHPVPSCRPRQRWFGLTGSRGDNLNFANTNLRTISRVIVHPQFRSLGLSTLLV